MRREKCTRYGEEDNNKLNAVNCGKGKKKNTEGALKRGHNAGECKYKESKCYGFGK